MGFYAMVISLLIGICLIAFGVMHRKTDAWYKLALVLGIVLVLFSVYLGFPK